MNQSEEDFEIQPNHPLMEAMIRAVQTGDTVTGAHVAEFLDVLGSSVPKYVICPD